MPNGGPRPVSENNKRAAEPWVAMELCALGELDQCLDSDTRHRRQADDIDFDPFDEYENELQEARSTAAVRLSDDLALALRQVRPKLCTQNCPLKIVHNFKLFILAQNRVSKMESPIYFGV